MKFEKCCFCGKETDVPFDTPIDQRTGFIEGAGQLCLECYRKMYHPSKNEKDEKLVQATLNAAREDFSSTPAASSAPSSQE